jgi:hypothetical protein
MTPSKEKRLRETFQRVYRDREAATVSEFWKPRTMARIRELADAASMRLPSQIEFATRLIWRFAGIAAVAAVLVSVYAMQLDWNPELEMARLFLQDPIEFGILETTGIL